MKLVQGILYSGTASCELRQLELFVGYLTWQAGKHERQHIS